MAASQGLYEKVMARATGNNEENSFDPNKIFNAISRYSTRLPLPAEILCSMSKKELDWLESNGGRASIGQWNESRLKRELRLY
jgi:hypothetical protein